MNQLIEKSWWRFYRLLGSYHFWILWMILFDIRRKNWRDHSRCRFGWWSLNPFCYRRLFT